MNRLYRSRTDRMLFGVAGGMADWLDLDPSVVRLVWALLVLAGGVGFLLYIVAAIVIPEEPLGAPAPADMADTGSSGAGGPTAAPSGPGWDRHAAREARRAARRDGSNSGAVVLGVILVLAGAWFLAQRYLPGLDGRLIWPGILIVVGVILLLGAMRRGGQA